MSDIHTLQDGLYEKVLSTDFAKKVESALAAKEIWAEREEVDAQEAVGYLSEYLAKLIRISLNISLFIFFVRDSIINIFPTHFKGFL